MHLIRLLAPRLLNENHTKDIDFSPDGIITRWQAGYDRVCHAIDDQPWQRKPDMAAGAVIP